MPTIAPPALLTGPTRTPLPFGLFSAVSFLEGAGRWENGATWQAVDCEVLPPVIVNDCDPAQITGLPKQIEGHLAEGHATAFTVYGTALCNPMGFRANDADDAARSVLLAGEEAAVGKAVWAAILADDDYADLGSKPTAAEALGTIECWLRSHYGSQGVLQVGCLAVALLAEKGILNVSGTRMTDVYGTPVVINDAPSDAELAISPAMLAYRSEVFTSGDVFSQANNDLLAVAERTYLVGWDPCGTASIKIGATP